MIFCKSIETHRAPLELDIHQEDENVKGKALLANDRLKLYLTMLQSAAQHAGSPAAPLADWGRKLALSR